MHNCTRGIAVADGLHDALCHGKRIVNEGEHSMWWTGDSYTTLTTLVMVDGDKGEESIKLRVWDEVPEDSTLTFGDTRILITHCRISSG